MYKWTVNLKFLPEEVFLSKKLSIFLLLMTVLTLVLFSYKWISENNKYLIDKYGKNYKRNNIVGLGKLCPNFIILTIFTSNFIGIAFARTLHYQFYSWYFHMIPYILWHIRIPIVLKIILFMFIEISFNKFPATSLSSSILEISHIIILFGIWLTPAPIAVIEDIKITTKKQKANIKTK